MTPTFKRNENNFMINVTCDSQSLAPRISSSVSVSDHYTYNDDMAPLISIQTFTHHGGDSLMERSEEKALELWHSSKREPIISLASLLVERR